MSISRKEISKRCPGMGVMQNRRAYGSAYHGMTYFGVSGISQRQILPPYRQIPRLYVNLSHTCFGLQQVSDLAFLCDQVSKINT